MSMNFYCSLYCAMPGLNAVYETKSRALLSAGLCVTVRVVCPGSQPRLLDKKKHFRVTVFEPLLLFTSESTVGFLTFTVFLLWESVAHF